jgi:hypothetical protein
MFPICVVHCFFYHNQSAAHISSSQSLYFIYSIILLIHLKLKGTPMSNRVSPNSRELRYKYLCL